MKNTKETELLLSQILLLPSEKIVTDRFAEKSSEAAICGATCSGQCHGFA
jgi:hypothetical protein